MSGCRARPITAEPATKDFADRNVPMLRTSRLNSTTSCRKRSLKVAAALSLVLLTGIAWPAHPITVYLAGDSTMAPKYVAVQAIREANLDLARYLKPEPDKWLLAASHST